MKANLNLINEKLCASKKELENEKQKIRELIRFISEFFNPKWECVHGRNFLGNYFNFIFGKAKLIELGNEIPLPDISFNSFFIHNNYGVTLYREDWPLRSEEDLKLIDSYYFEQGCRVYKLSLHEGKEIGTEFLKEFESDLRESSPCNLGVFEPEDPFEFFEPLDINEDQLNSKFEDYCKMLIEKKIPLNDDRIALVGKYVGFKFEEDDKQKLICFIENGIKEQDIIHWVKIHGIRIILRNYFNVLCFNRIHCKTLNLLFWYNLMHLRLQRIRCALELLNKPLIEAIETLQTQELPIKSMPIDLIDLLSILKKGYFTI